MIEKPPLLEGDVRVFTLSDVKRLLLKMRRKVLRAAYIGGVVCLAFFAVKPVQYKAEAVFKEGVEKNGSDAMLKSVLGNISFGDSQPQAITLMKSNQVLKPLVQKLGLQASVSGGGPLSKLYKRFRDLFVAEMGKSLPDVDSFVFADVEYEREGGFFCWLRFDRDDCFTLLDGNKQEISSGNLGIPVSFGDGSFTLLKAPTRLRYNRLYPLKISNWISVVKRLKNQILIKNHKTNTSMYDLQFLHRDRHFAMKIINQLMVEYQKYLKRDHDQIAEAQLAYLMQKQDGIFQQLAGVLDSHADYLKENLCESGFLGLEEESVTILGSHREMANQLIALDIELERLDEWAGGELFSSARQMGHFNDNLSQIVKSVQELKSKKDLLEFSLHQREAEEGSEYRAQIRSDEMKEIRKRKETAEKLLNAFEEGKEFVFDFPLFEEEKSLATWANRLQIGLDQDRDDFADFLSNHIRLLSVREKVLQERLFMGEAPPLELDGMSSETIDLLFREYTSKLDASDAALRCYNQVRNQILYDDFELSSLSSILLDPLSKKLISDAGEVSLRLKDEAHRTSKEGERFKEELNLQKKILREHLEQLSTVEELNTALYKDKIRDLQKSQLDYIHRQISVLSQQATDVVKQRRESLIQESLILKKKMKELQKIAIFFPEKWKRESWLVVKKEMGTRIMETITELVESKTIGHHLHHVESKPLDLAILPLQPEKPNLVPKFLLGAFGSGFFFFFTSLIGAILNGFPSSFDKLRALKFPLLGEISSHCDGPISEISTGPDLELLRQAALFLTSKPQNKIVSLLLGKGPNFSHALADTLSRMSLRSIVIHLDFQSKFTAADRPGIVQIWRKEIGEIPIRKGKHFDSISSGGYTPFGTEIIQSKEMTHILDSVKKHYDFVFLLFRSPLGEAEAAAALRISECAIVSVNGEPTELLTPFINWAYHEGENRLTFVVAGAR